MKYNGEEIGIPKVWQIAEYIAFKRYDLNAQAIYDKYDKNGWLKSNGEPVKSLEAIINAQNGVKLEKVRKGETKKERKRRKLERLSFKKQKRKEFHKNTISLKELEKEVVKVTSKKKGDYIPYKEQLKDKRWRKLRKEILKERGNKCELCNSSEKLCIHHKVYIKGRYAWEYPKRHLIALCSRCHEMLHGIDLDKRFDFLIND